jgi:hypothetical protein
MPEDKLPLKDFAARIKQKYPTYKDMPDDELVNKIVEKYPEYKQRIIFPEPPAPPVNNTKEVLDIAKQLRETKNIISQSEQSTPVSVGGGSMIPMAASVGQSDRMNEKIKVKQLGNRLKGLGYNAEEVEKEFADLPYVGWYNIDKALQEKKENPQSYERTKAAIRWQVPLADAIRAKGGENAELIVQDILSRQSAKSREEVRNNMRNGIAAVRHYVDDPQEQEKIIAQIVKDKSFGYGQIEETAQQSFEQDPRNERLNHYQLNALQFMEDTEPEKYKTFNEYMNVNPAASPSALRGWEFKARELERMGMGLEQKALEEQLTSLVNKKDKGELTEQDAQRYLKLYDQYETLQKDIEVQSKRYPNIAALDADMLAQEAIQQRNGSFKKFVLGVGEDVDDVANWIGDTVQSPFLSKSEKRFDDLEDLGDKKVARSSMRYTTAANQLLNPNYVHSFTKDLQAQIDKVKADESLSVDEKINKTRQIILDNPGKVSFVANDKAGKFNFTANAWANTVSDVASSIFSQAGLAFTTGGAGNVSKLKQARQLFTTVFATTYHDKYVEAMEKGIANPSTYATVHSAIEASTGLINNDLAVVKNLVNPKSTLGKIVGNISKEQWDAIAKSSRKFAVVKKALANTGRAMGSNTFREVFEEMTGQAASNIASDKFFNEETGLMEGMKETFVNTLLGTLPLSIIGLPAQFGKLNRSQKYAIYEAAQNSEKFLSQLEADVQSGAISKKKAEQIRAVIERAAEVYGKGKKKASENLSDNEKTDLFAKEVFQIEEEKEGDKKSETTKPALEEKPKTVFELNPETNGTEAADNTGNEAGVTKNDTGAVIEPDRPMQASDSGSGEAVGDQENVGFAKFADKVDESVSDLTYDEYLKDKKDAIVYDKNDLKVYRNGDGNYIVTKGGSVLLNRYGEVGRSKAVKLVNEINGEDFDQKNFNFNEGETKSGSGEAVGDQQSPIIEAIKANPSTPDWLLPSLESDPEGVINELREQVKQSMQGGLENNTSAIEGVYGKEAVDMVRDEMRKGTVQESGIVEDIATPESTPKPSGASPKPKAEQSDFDVFKESVLTDLENETSSAFDFTFDEIPLQQSHRKTAVKNIRAGKSTVATKRVLEAVQKMFDDGYVYLTRGRGAQTERIQIPLKEYLKEIKKPIEATELDFDMLNTELGEDAFNETFDNIYNEVINETERSGTTTETKAATTGAATESVTETTGSESKPPVDEEVQPTAGGAAQKLANSIQSKGKNKAMAEWLRSKKLKGGAMVTVDFGLTKAVYNSGLELMAKHIEKGTKFGKALADVISRIDKAMGAGKWDKAGFVKEMTKTYAVKINGRDEVVTRDDSKETAEAINGFYSPLEQRILDAKDEKLPANKWLERLNTDEAKWTGVKDFLASKGSEKVSKAELKAFMRDNRIEVVEVVKGSGVADISPDDIYNGGRELIANQTPLTQEYEDVFDEYISNPSDENLSKVKDIFDENYLDYDEFINSVKEKNTEDKTKYSNYQLAGEKENYREVLVTLPNAESRRQELVKLDRERPLTEAEQQEYKQLVEATRNKPAAFLSSHWDEPNILVHLRMNTRKDAEGKKVLFIEEVQSDWGQKGKKEGFSAGYNKEFKVGDVFNIEGTTIIIEEIKKDADGDIMLITNDGFLTEKRLRDDINKFGIQSAPFVTDTNSWAKLGIKMALKEAVNQGVDKLAWTTGEQQNERYDLSKQVDYIEVTEGYLGERDILYADISTPTSLITLRVDGRVEKGKILEAKNAGTPDMVGKNLEDVVGKDMAQKILDAPNNTKFEGEGLKVGGKGMKGFYGEPSENKIGIIGGVAKAVVKELTGKDVEIGEVNVKQRGITYHWEGQRFEGDTHKVVDSEGRIVSEHKTHKEAIAKIESLPAKMESTTQHSIPITPELKESVNQGMPLFGESKPTRLTDKIRAYAQQVREGKAAGFGGNMPEGVRKAGFSSKGFNEASARAIEIFAEAIDRTGDFAQAVKEGFEHLKKYLSENTLRFDEAKWRSGFEAKVKELYDEYVSDMGRGDGSGVRHVDTAELRKEFSLPDYEKKADTVEAWDAEADARIANGEMGDVLEKLKTTSDITAVETRMMGKYIATLAAKADENPTPENIRELRDAIALIEVAGSKDGKALRARQGIFLPDDSLSGNIVKRQEAAGVDALTEKQLKEVEDLVNDLKKANKDAADKLAELERRNVELQAELEIANAKKAAKPTKKDFKSERRDIKQSIKEKWNKAANDGTLTAVPVPYAKQLVAIAPDVAKLMKSYVEEGVVSLVEIIDRIHGDVQEVIPEVTKADVFDIVAGEYTEPRQTKNEILEKLRDLRDEAVYLNKLEALNNGVEPKTEAAKKERNRRIKELQEKIKEHDVTKLSQIKKRNEQRTKELEEKLRNGDFENKRKASAIDNTELAKKYPDLYKATLNAIRAREEAKHKIDLANLNEQMARQTMRQKIVGHGARALRTAKALLAGIDDSAVFVQNMIAVLANLGTAQHALKEHVLDALSAARFERNLAKLHSSAYWPLIEQSGLSVVDPKSLRESEKNDIFNDTYFDYLKIKTKGGKEVSLAFTKPFERAFTSLGNNLRVHIFLRKVEELEAQGKTFENAPEEYKSVASVINNISGRGTMIKSVEKHNDILSAVLWSPRLLASSLNILGVSDIAMLFAKDGKGFYANLTPAQRRFVAEQVIKGVGLGIAIMAALAYSTGGEADLDPTSVTFGTVKVGDYRYTLFGRYNSVIRMIFMRMQGKKTINDKEIVLDAKAYGASTGNEMWKFLRGKANPIFGLGIDLATKKTFDGKPVTLEDEAERMLTPMSISEFKKGFEQDGLKGLVVRGIPSFTGIKVSNEKDFERRKPASNKKPTRPKRSGKPKKTNPT